MDGIKTNKKDSLEFLQNCADKIVNASAKDIKNVSELHKTVNIFRV